MGVVGTNVGLERSTRGRTDIVVDLSCMFSKMLTLGRLVVPHTDLSVGVLAVLLEGRCWSPATVQGKCEPSARAKLM